jgi:hypothetical protein
MANDFYNHDNGYPAFGAQGASAAMRSELDKIAAAFNKLPLLAGKANYVLVVNAAGTAIDLVLTTGTGSVVRNTDPTFVLTDTTTNNATTVAHGWLPKLPGNTTTFLRGDGSFAAQGNSSLQSSTRTTNTIIAGGDTSKVIEYTGSVDFTQTLSTPATLANGFFAYLRNSGSARVEIEAAATISTTSTTSNSIAAGVNWTVPTGLAINTGDLVILRRTSDPYAQRVVGTVTSYTSGTGALIISAIARVGSGTFTDWTITTRPSTAGIDGVASYVIYPGECRLLYIDPTNSRYVTSVVTGFYLRVLTSFVYIHPPGYSMVDADLVGGSGGSGSGRRGAAGTNRNGGAPGGAPGRVWRPIRGMTPGAGYQVNIGAAGVAGPAQTVNDTDGNNGTAGGNSSIGTIATAFGGTGGLGGNSGAGAFVGVSGSGSISAGTSVANAGSNGGLPISSNGIASGATGSLSRNNTGEGGAATTNAVDLVGANSEFGGASSATPNNSLTVSTSGSSMRGASSGGNGGVITSSNTVPANAGTAGQNGSYVAGGGALGGVCGVSPTAGVVGADAANDNEVGSAGGGGGSSISTAAAAGGKGGFPGGSPGGGGASLNGSNSGAGADGQPGRVVLKGVA